MQIGGGQKQDIDFIQFNIIIQLEQNGAFKVDRFVTKTQIIDNHTFEAMNLGQDSYCYTLPLKCIKRETYLKAMDFASVTRKITIAEDILASMAVLGVSKRIALLDCGLYYYCYNGDSATRSLESSKIQERIENLNFVISKFKNFANKKDEYYKVFMQGLIRVLHTHIAWNQQLLLDVHKKQIYNELYNFVANNKTIFEPYLPPQSQKANIVKDIEIYEPTRLRKKYKKYKRLFNIFLGLSIVYMIALIVLLIKGVA